jgi:phosphoglycerol transferase MdoB-like AlkP superfamily enzyme
MTGSPSAPTTRAPALAAVVLCAKALVVALRVADGGGGGLRSPWAPAVLVYQDVELVLAFGAGEAALAAAGARWPRARRACAALVLAAYAAIALWTAVNVTVARLFSTPATFAFLHATGGALGDSARALLTPASVAAPLVVVALAALLARRPPAAPPARARAAAAVLLGALALLGAAAAGRVATLGIHRNAVVTLVASTVDNLVAARAPGAPRGPRPAACRPTAGAAADLRDLAAAARGRNVVWVILESTGARFLTPYGAAREVTPNLAALAREALLFEHAYAAYPESIKGLFSMLCGRAPPPGRTAAELAAGRVACDALPRALAEAGYRTGLFHSGRFAYLGMNAVVRARGFDRLEDGASIGGAFSSSFGVDDPSTVRKLLAFVDAVPPGQPTDRPFARPFFAVYMPIAGHHPYHAPGRGPRPFVERSVADAYANDLFAGDAAFGLLRDGLRRRGLDDRTLYVVVGDHGEAFLEHEGNFAHSLFLYEENVRVPFLVAAPGLLGAARRAPQIASLVDVAPTVLALLGLPPSALHEGRSLLIPEPRLQTFFTDQAVPQAALRDGRWKMIEDLATARAQLYDLGADPGERVDVAQLEPERVRRYRECLEAR